MRQPSLWKPETSKSGGPTIALLRAQPEHAIGQSYPTGTAKNYQNSGDSKRPAKVRMTIDKDSRNPKTDSQHHAQGAIHSPYIQKRHHVGSGIRRFLAEISQGSSKSRQFRVYTCVWRIVISPKIPQDSPSCYHSLMRNLPVFFIHFIAVLARLLGPGGVRSIIAESLLLKHQLLI
jgi:hypothetical protein